MVGYIAILEDYPARMAAMQTVLAGRFGRYASLFIHTAPAMIEWIQGHYESLALLSLDHDLGLVTLATDEAVNPGDGRDVANFLQNLRPVCPVILHTSNPWGRQEMEATLTRAGWPVYIVRPEPDLTWIETAWARQIRQCLCKH